MYFADPRDLSFIKAVVHKFVIGHLMLYPMKNDIYLVKTHAQRQRVIGAS